MDTQDRRHQEDEQGPIESLVSGKSALDAFSRAIFVVVLIEIALLFFLGLYQKNRIENLTNTLANQRAELTKPENSAINTQIEEVLSGNDLLKGVLASKVRWSGFYRLLNAVTPKNVRLTTISVTESGSFKADGETSSLTSLAQALVAWQKGTTTAVTPFSSVSLNANSFSNTEDNRKVTFSISGIIETGRLK